MLRTTYLPAFTGVAAGEAATCNLDLGLLYDAFWLILGDDGTASTGNAAAPETTLAVLIGDIRFIANSQVQRTMSGVQLNQLNSLMGADYALKTSGTAGQAGYRIYLPIFFGERWRQTNAEKAMLRFNANPANLKDLQIEVDFNAGIVAPVIKGIAEWEPMDPKRGVGAICKWSRTNLQAVGTENDFPMPRKDFVQSIHFWPTVQAAPRYVTSCELKASGMGVIHDKITHLENQAALLGQSLQPDTGAVPRFDIVLDKDDPINSALPADGLASFNAKITWNDAAAGNMPTIIQRVGALEG